jgi:hypothetical protein
MKNSSDPIWNHIQGLPVCNDLMVWDTQFVYQHYSMKLNVKILWYLLHVILT